MTGRGSPRRFELGDANQPILQFIASTLPFFFLLLGFLYSAAVRPDQPCYDDPNNFDDDAFKSETSQRCSRLVPLKQYVYVYMGVAFVWSLLAGYLFYYVPRRHQMTEAYLTQGETMIGDIHFSRKRGVPTLSSYGFAVYRNPDDATTTLRKRIRVFERYTRERVAIVYLPGKPYSGQSKRDLEIDRDVTNMNASRMEILLMYSGAWAAFALLAPLYILQVMNRLESDNPSVWQVDVGLENFSMWYYLVAFVGIPLVALLWNVVAWAIHERWMTEQHRTMEENQSPSGNMCCFDDDECESIEMNDYRPPQVDSMKREEPAATTTGAMA